MGDLSAISSDDRKKINNFMITSLHDLQEIDGIKEGLKEKIKAVAEEFDLAPKELGLAVRTAYKNALADKKKEMDVVEEILNLTGHG